MPKSLMKSSLLTSSALVAGLVALAISGKPASAVTALTLENPGTVNYQQTLNNPCVIGDPSCHNPTGFGEGQIPSGPQAQYDVSSPIYTVLQITSIVGSNTFKIGVDVNTTTKPLATEMLDLFTMSVNGVVVASYDPASPGTQLYTVNNGNGYSDELLSGFSLAGLAPTDSVTFRAVVNNATDGVEEFFLISSTATNVPEPISIGLLGMGLTGLGAARNKRVASAYRRFRNKFRRVAA